MTESSATQGKFMYFAYGSNMNGKRLSLNCPGSQPLGPALLRGYKLSFWNLKAGPDLECTWHGAVATIVEDRDAEVWGVLWSIPSCHLDALDRYACHLVLCVGSYHQLGSVCSVLSCTQYISQHQCELL